MAEHLRRPAELASNGSAEALPPYPPLQVVDENYIPIGEPYRKELESDIAVTPQHSRRRRPQTVQYEPDGRGLITLGVEFTGKYAIADWAKYSKVKEIDEDGTLFYTKDGGEFYARGNNLVDL